MEIKEALNFDELWQRFINYSMDEKDKKLFIESLILIIIYFVSFVILSMGRVQQEFFGISADSVSSIQIMILTFIFAVLITLIVYYAYRRIKQWA